jgi:hypothetical protein
LHGSIVRRSDGGSKDEDPTLSAAPKRPAVDGDSLAANAVYRAWRLALTLESSATLNQIAS